MNACRWEADVLRAATEDRWPENLRRHLAECEDCVATAAVAPWMSTFAGIRDQHRVLPDPSIVWLKAKLLQGTMDSQRAARPLTVVQILAYLVVAGGWAAVMTWKWDAVQAWISSLTPASVVTANAPSLSMSFFALIFVLASMTVMVALHTIMAED